MVIAGFQLSGLARSIVYKVLLFLLLFFGGLLEVYAQFYPVHGVVQWPSPQSPHLVDYYSGSRDRLIITLHNRDLQQPLLLARLRVQIKSNGFLAQTREEFPYPMLELMAGTPTRLTATDLMPYLRPENLHFNGRLRNGQLPTGFTEISVQVIDYYSKKVLSTWHTARAYLDSKQPPILNLPQRDELVAYREPLFIRFQWYPRHQGLAGTEYEFVLKELPDNGAAPQAAFAYGNEIYRTRTRHTTLNYTHLEPILLPNRRYAWQVQAIARDGVDEIGMFENGGFSEIYWFSLNENCPVPTGLKAEPRYAKVDFSWNRVIGATGYMLACRPKTSKDIYEWSEVQSYGERMTLAQLKPGWTYEWRVGTLCTGDKPIYSAVQEVTLPKTNLDLLRDCGKEPPRPNLSPEPALDVRVGDTVTIGGDYPMLITELQSLGDGWYSGRGTTRLSSIIELPRVALRFDRLRINIERCQIDGLVEAVYDEKLGKIADLDKVDGGGKDIKPSQLRIRTRELAFALPEMPQMSLSIETGEIEVRDAEGKPQRIKLDLPEGGDYASAFPMVITDSEGKSYQVSSPESSRGLDDRRLGESTSEDSVGKQKPLKVERVEHIGAFSADTLETKYGFVRFEQGNGRYGFDLGAEKWYQKTTILDAFYKPFGKGYIAPWKLIPVGEQDEVIAKYEGRNISNLAKVRFASAPNSTAIPAEFDESTKTWKLTLPATDSNSSYDVFALYEGKVIGKLRVVSYPKQSYKLRLVSVNGQSVGDVSRLSQQLNGIYNKYGVSFTLYEGEGMTAMFSSANLKSELKELNKQYKQTHTLTSEDVCIFVVSEELSKGSKYEEVEGLMQRGKRFGYIFAGNSPNEDKLARTLAHELGHGLFTLGHTFDSDYNKGKRGVTNNLMDYGDGATELAAYQWNIMANPAPFTGFDRDKDAQIREYASCMVSITPEISQKILASGKSILSASGEKIKLPTHAQITALFYKDTSEHPAPVGSLAVFKLDGLNYLTHYNTKSSKFAGYKSSKEESYTEVKSKLSPVHIEIDEASHKVIVEGEEFQLSKSEFSCLSERNNPSKTVRFDLSRASKDKIAFGTAEWEKTQVALEKQADLVDTFAQLVKDFDGEKSYLGEVLSDKLLAYEKLNGCKFVVVRAPSHVLSLNQSSWTDFTQAVFSKSGLGSRDILITIPYVKAHTLLTDGVVLHMPGLAYGSEVVIDDSKLMTSYDPSQSLPEFLSGASAQGIVQYIWDVFAQTKKKLRTINALINYQGVIAISKPIGEVKTGIPSSCVFNLGVDSLYADFADELRVYLTSKERLLSTPGTLVPWDHLEKQREGILNYAKTHHVGNIAFVSHGLNERIGISNPKHCEQFAQWYAYHVAKQVPHVEPVSSPLGECFYEGKNKVIYNETLDQFDRLSLGLSPFGFDWLADGLGAVYAGVNGELLEATTRAGFTFIPVLSAGTGRLTAKQIKEAVLNGELRLLKESGQSTPVIAQRANAEAGLEIKQIVENPFNELNQLKPNIKFKTGEFDYWGETDELGRLTSMSTNNLQLTTRTNRLPHNPNTPGKAIGDDAGHIIADRFGGSPILDNLVSQLRSVNRSEFARYERRWANAISKGSKVEIKIQVLYEGDSFRPSGFKIDYTIDGGTYETVIIPNN